MMNDTSDSAFLTDVDVVFPTCPKCGVVAELVTGEVVYPKTPSTWGKHFWRCPGECDTLVGCHPGTTVELGELADYDTRQARRRAHGAFDKLWKDGLMSRSAAYRWLREELGLTAEKCHIALFDMETCGVVVALCTHHLHKLGMKS